MSRRKHPAHLLSFLCIATRGSLCAVATATILTLSSGITLAVPQSNAHPQQTTNASSPNDEKNAPSADSMDALIRQLNSANNILADTDLSASTTNSSTATTAATQDRLLPFITERLADTTASPDVSTQTTTNHPPAESHLVSPSERVFNAALEMLGTRYTWGGNSKQQGFDCSGLVKAVYKKALAVELPRSAHAQANSSQLMSINRQELAAGDLVFFNTRGKTYSHVGVYLGDRQFMHAPRKGKNVRIDSMGKSYWSKRFTGARRALNFPAATTPSADRSNEPSGSIGGAVIDDNRS